jgi:hypothetical protein
MGIFFTKYTVGVTLVHAPQLAHQMSFALPVSALYGIFSGVFVGQAASLWRLAARSAQPGSGRPAAPNFGKWIAGIVCGVAVVAALGLGGLIVFGTASPPVELTSVSDPMRHIDFSDLPPLQQFKARDGQALSYRQYPGTGPGVVVLIHGSSGESSGMHAVAKTLSAIGDTVYAPDLRGHGHDGNPGDIGYIGQVDDDLVDFVSSGRFIRVRMSSSWATPPAAHMSCGLRRGPMRAGSRDAWFCHPRRPLRSADQSGAPGRAGHPRPWRQSYGNGDGPTGACRHRHHDK